METSLARDNFVSKVKAMRAKCTIHTQYDINIL